MWLISVCNMNEVFQAEKEIIHINEKLGLANLELEQQKMELQRAYAQANELIEQATAQAQAILDNATEEANSIRYGAMQYTDDMLAKLQYIIEHSIKDNKEKYDSLLSGLENVLSVVNNNRNELSGIEEGETEETVQNNSEDSDSTDTDNNE